MISLQCVSFEKNRLFAAHRNFSLRTQKKKFCDEMGLSAMLCIGIYILWCIVIVCRYHPISGFRKGLEYQREITMAKSTDKKKVVAKEAVVQEDAIRLESGSDLSSESGESELEVSESESEDEIEGMETEQSGHHIKKLDTSKKQKATKKDDKDSDISGIIYVGRLPKGFHERELSKYFSQFGDLKEVRLARNKKTGNSRHYGFVQFVNTDDSRVAYDTMNNYLLMGHLLQVRLLPKGSKIEKLYKYKQRAFMSPPKAKKSAKELKKLAEEKHKERMEKLSKAGIDYQY